MADEAELVRSTPSRTPPRTPPADTSPEPSLLEDIGTIAAAPFKFLYNVAALPGKVVGKLMGNSIAGSAARFILHPITLASAAAIAAPFAIGTNRGLFMGSDGVTPSFTGNAGVDGFLHGTGQYANAGFSGVSNAAQWTADTASPYLKYATDGITDGARNFLSYAQGRDLIPTPTGGELAEEALQTPELNP